MGDDPRTVLLVVDDDAASLATTEAELRKRYGTDYQVVAFTDADEALTYLAEAHALGRAVALIIADLWMPPTTGAAFLANAHDLYPTTKRALLANWGDPRGREAILTAFAVGQADLHLMKPTQAPDEAFHQIVTEVLAEWSRTHSVRRARVRVIGERSSPRCHEIRDLLERHSVPFEFVPSDSDEGRDALAGIDADGASAPVLALADGRVLIDPTNLEAADALGGPTDLADNSFEVVVVGAGPAGLAAAVYAASEGLRTLVVEREAIGGQAGTTSRIRNYLGFPRGVSGSDLAVRAFEQAVSFGAQFSLMREAGRLVPGVERHRLTLSGDKEVEARAVVVATGVSYRRLGVPSLERHIGRGVFYGPAVSEAPAMEGRRVHVVGGGNSAGQAAVHLAKYAAEVTLLVRATSLDAGMSDYLVREIQNTRNITVRFSTEAVGGLGDHHLDDLHLRDVTAGTVAEVASDGLFVLIGGAPRTDWLPDRVRRSPDGYVLSGPAVGGGEPLLLETSVPGVFAAGDVRHGSIKRVASAAGEGAMVVAMIHQHLLRPSAQPASR